MPTYEQLLKEIMAMPLEGKVRVLNLSGNHERVISLSGLRDALPSQIELLAGPGCAASVCPRVDLYQVIQVAQRHSVTVHVPANLLHLPLGAGVPGPGSLYTAGLAGADVRAIDSPIEAVVAARAAPDRPMMLFLAGFETLLAPLAGMILDGLPDNLSLALCGRRIQPFLDRLITQNDRPPFEALILPGNRCAVTGLADWEHLAGRHGLSCAVTGYSLNNLLVGLHRVLDRHVRGEPGIDNCYRVMVRHEGNALARDRLDRVFDLADGEWRGFGVISGSAFMLRNAYAPLDAVRVYPDYRGELLDGEDLPDGCECAAVTLGRKEPVECREFQALCRTASPYGPCMASEDGACHLREDAAGRY